MATDNLNSALGDDQLTDLLWSMVSMGNHQLGQWLDFFDPETGEDVAIRLREE